MNAPYRKNYFYKVFSVSGTNSTPISVWNDAIGLPSFDTSINGGLNEMSISLPRKWSSFGETLDVANGNMIELYVSDRDTGDDDAKLLASGFISGYTPVLSSKSDEYIRVTVLGSSVRLQDAILTASGVGVTDLNFYSQDPTDILRYIVQQFNSTVSGTTSFDTDFDQTGTTVTYNFSLATYREAIDKVLELSPKFWWYSVDPDGTIQFHPRRYAADHQLVIGNHISQIEPFKNIEDVKNVVYFIGDGIKSVYRNATSILQYGEKSTVLQDLRVSLQSSADIIANSYLNEHSSPEVRTRLTVLDNNDATVSRGYDIESFSVGQAVSIIHPELQFEQTNWDEFTWDDAKWDGPIQSVISTPMRIVRIQYQGDRAILELATKIPDVSKRIEDINRNLQQFITTQSV